MTDSPTTPTARQIRELYDSAALQRDAIAALSPGDPEEIYAKALVLADDLDTLLAWVAGREPHPDTVLRRSRRAANTLTEAYINIDRTSDTGQPPAAPKAQAKTGNDMTNTIDPNEPTTDLSDKQAMDLIARYVNERGEMSGADFIMFVTNLLPRTGRRVIDNVDEDEDEDEDQDEGEVRITHYPGQILLNTVTGEFTGNARPTDAGV